MNERNERWKETRRERKGEGSERRGDERHRKEERGERSEKGEREER